MSEQTVGLGNGADTTKAATAAAVAEKKARGTTTSDPKLVACIRIAKQLDVLDENDREFTLTYICDKYGIKVAD
jgi:hypothetical protein